MRLHDPFPEGGAIVDEAGAVISENAVSALMRCLLDANVLCIRSGIKSSINRSRTNPVFRLTGGAVIIIKAIRKGPSFIRLPRKKMLQRLMSLPVPFSGAEAEDEYTGVCDAQRFDVLLPGDVGWRNAGKIDVAVSPPGSADHFARLVGTDVVEASLSLLTARPRFSLTLGEEKNMMETGIPAPELNLGRLELSMRDFLALRPGDVLCFRLPAEVEGTLQLSGEDWARVGVEFDGESIRLKVLETGGRTTRPPDGSCK